MVCVTFVVFVSELEHANNYFYVIIREMYTFCVLCSCWIRFRGWRLGRRAKRGAYVSYRSVYVNKSSLLYPVCTWGGDGHVAGARCGAAQAEPADLEVAAAAAPVSSLSAVWAAADVWAAKMAVSSKRV